MSKLDDKRFNGYLKMRLPHELDSVVDSFIDAYQSATGKGRQELVGSVSHRAAAVLSSFGQRMAAQAVRSGSEKPLERAVVAIAIAEQRLLDPRENLIVLAAMNHSAELLNSSLPRIAARMAGTIPPRITAALEEFCQRDEQDKSLKSMGLGASGSGGTFLYVSAS
ncbi:hypothetical protein ACFWWM_37895 [Streptomyces sp. NPDC058682]|uniref:hypothetical protein n=1 Tax=Streptomyces sp. NPDC058682 TaxID=3346596 RepID=UPI0036620AC6